MTDQESRTLPTDFLTASRLSPQEAAFYYRGSPQVVADGVVFTPSTGGVTHFICGDRMLVVDTSLFLFARGILDEVRQRFSQSPVEAIVYTHGHIDHVSGAHIYIQEAEQRGHPRPQIIGHADVARRFDRYRMLDRQNNFINNFQFNMKGQMRAFSVTPWVYPDITYYESMELTVGGERFELYHSRGETDDQTWVWCPARRVACAGDMFIWATPNVGNPLKVPRYCLDLAINLERMAALKPLHLLPGHGPAISGEEQVQDALLSTASWLRSIHDQVVEGMNQEKFLEDILRDIKYPPNDRPWLKPIYDHPEFVARNVYRLYGGWYDGNPAHILPAHSHDVARELISVTGSAGLLARARELRDKGDLQMACHMVDFVRRGEPDNREAWELWRDLFKARLQNEPSLMARGVFLSAIDEAERRLAALSSARQEGSR